MTSEGRCSRGRGACAAGPTMRGTGKAGLSMGPRNQLQRRTDARGEGRTMSEVSTPGLKAPSMPCSNSNMCFFPSRCTCSRSLAASCSRQGSDCVGRSSQIDEQAVQADALSSALAGTSCRLLLLTGAVADLPDRRDCSMGEHHAPDLCLGAKQKHGSSHLGDFHIVVHVLEGHSHGLERQNHAPACYLPPACRVISQLSVLHPGQKKSGCAGILCPKAAYPGAELLPLESPTWTRSSRDFSNHDLPQEPLWLLFICFADA